MKQQSGFSMLEVLVSMLVIMLGALGIAGMQLLAITSTENARYQNVATMLGGNMAAAMQANVAYWGTPPAAIAVTGASNTGGPPAYSGCVGLANVCTNTQMAASDLTEWGTQVALLLPGGHADISCPGATSPAICTVKLSWIERNVSLHNATGTEAGDLKAGEKMEHTYQTLVSIL